MCIYKIEWISILYRQHAIFSFQYKNLWHLKEIMVSYPYVSPLQHSILRYVCIRILYKYNTVFKYYLRMLQVGVNVSWTLSVTGHLLLWNKKSGNTALEVSSSNPQFTECDSKVLQTPLKTQLYFASVSACLNAICRPQISYLLMLYQVHF